MPCLRATRPAASGSWDSSACGQEQRSAAEGAGALCLPPPGTVDGLAVEKTHSVKAIADGEPQGYHGAVAWLARTFTTDTGGKPVEEWMASLAPQARAVVLILIDLLEERGTALREPFAKHVEDGIWELRARGPDGAYRVLYFHWFGHTFGLLHGVTKRTQKTPRAELEIARRRRDIWRTRPGPPR